MWHLPSLFISSHSPRLTFPRPAHRSPFSHQFFASSIVVSAYFEKPLPSPTGRMSSPPPLALLPLPPLIPYLCLIKSSISMLEELQLVAEEVIHLPTKPLSSAQSLRLSPLSLPPLLSPLCSLPLPPPLIDTILCASSSVASAWWKGQSLSARRSCICRARSSCSWSAML